MSRDARLGAWLDATRVALEAPATERQAALERLAAKRAELSESLRAEPLTEPIDAELSSELEAAEIALRGLLDALARDARMQLEELRRVRDAASGYRPAMANHPAFVSRSV